MSERRSINATTGVPDVVSVSQGMLAVVTIFGFILIVGLLMIAVFAYIPLETIWAFAWGLKLRWVLADPTVRVLYVATIIGALSAFYVIYEGIRAFVWWLWHG
jgi:hypothetical protein